LINGKTALKELTLSATIFMALQQQNHNNCDELATGLIDYARLLVLERMRWLVKKSANGQSEYFSPAISGEVIDHEKEYQHYFTALYDKQFSIVKNEMLANGY
jgi:hypothetical protein